MIRRLNVAATFEKNIATVRASAMKLLSDALPYLASHANSEICHTDVLKTAGYLGSSRSYAGGGEGCSDK